VAQYSVAVIQFFGRALTLSALPDHERRRFAGLANQILTPLALVAMAALAYKFWA
jgi:hypothetical protein